MHEQSSLDIVKHLLHSSEADASRFLDLAPPRPADHAPRPGDQRLRRRPGAARADAPGLQRRPRPVVDHDPAPLRDRPRRRARAGRRPARRLRPLPAPRDRVARLWQAACCVGLALVDPLWLVYALVVALQVGQVVAEPRLGSARPVDRRAGRDRTGGRAASQALSARSPPSPPPPTAGSSRERSAYGAPLLIDAATFVGLAVGGAGDPRDRVRPAAAGRATETRRRAAAFSIWKDALLGRSSLGVCALVLVGESTNVVEVFLLRGTLGREHGRVRPRRRRARRRGGRRLGARRPARPRLRQGDAHGRARRARPRP